MKLFIEYLGYFAGFCTTVSFIPQVLKVWKSKNVNGISLCMFIIFTTGVSCWLIYGMLLKNIPLIIANTLTLVLAIIVLIGIIKFEKKN